MIALEGSVKKITPAFDVYLGYFELNLLVVLDEQHRLCAKLHYSHNASRITCNMYHIGGGVDQIITFSLKKKMTQFKR